MLAKQNYVSGALIGKCLERADKEVRTESEIEGSILALQVVRSLVSVGEKGIRRVVEGGGVSRVVGIMEMAKKVVSNFREKGNQLFIEAVLLLANMCKQGINLNVLILNRY